MESTEEKIRNLADLKNNNELDFEEFKNNITLK